MKLLLASKGFEEFARYSMSEQFKAIIRKKLKQLTHENTLKNDNSNINIIEICVYIQNILFKDNL